MEARHSRRVIEYALSRAPAPQQARRDLEKSHRYCGNASSSRHIAAQSVRISEFCTFKDELVFLGVIRRRVIAEAIQTELHLPALHRWPCGRRFFFHRDNDSGLLHLWNTNRQRRFVRPSALHFQPDSGRNPARCISMTLSLNARMTNSTSASECAVDRKPGLPSQICTPFSRR